MTLANGSLNAVKWLAFTTMTLDHINVLLLHSAALPLTLLGRLAFPLFAFLIAYNAVYRTQRPWRYLGRLVLFAAISQPIYAHALLAGRLNIFATLSVGLLGVLLGTDRLRRQVVWWSLLAAWIGLEEAHGWKPMSFGFGGAAAVVAFGFALKTGARGWWGITVATLVGLNLSVWSLADRVIATVAVLPLLWAARSVSVPMPRARWFWYSYYPLHLLILSLIRDNFRDL